MTTTTAWVFLAAAILSEVVATVALRVVSTGGRKAFVGIVVTGYVMSFTFLSVALDEGMALGVAYGVWTASGVAVTAVVSRGSFRRAADPSDGVRASP